MTKGGGGLPSRSLLCSNRSRLKRSPFPLSSRAYPDFLLAALERAACAVFCKENRMEFATSPTLTGNPGQPGDLQFRGPFLEMFFDGRSAVGPVAPFPSWPSSNLQ